MAVAVVTPFNPSTSMKAMTNLPSARRARSISLRRASRPDLAPERAGQGVEVGALESASSRARSSSGSSSLHGASGDRRLAAHRARSWPVARFAIQSRSAAERSREVAILSRSAPPSPGVESASRSAAAFSRSPAISPPVRAAL